MVPEVWSQASLNYSLYQPRMFCFFFFSQGTVKYYLPSTIGKKNKTKKLSKYCDSSENSNFEIHLDVGRVFSPSLLVLNK